MFNNKNEATMKKTYKNPTMVVVKIQTQHMIAMSTLGTTNATSGNLGREYDFDFDDDEE